MENSTNRYQEVIRRTLAGRSVAGTAIDGGLPRDAIRRVLQGHDSTLSRAAAICRALGVTFTIGADAPRDLYYGAANTDLQANATTHRTEDQSLPEGNADTAAMSSAQLRELESSTRGLNRVVTAAGGDPIPDDLWPVLAARRGAETGYEPPAKIIELSRGSAGDDDITTARPVDVVEIAAAAGGGAEATSKHCVGVSGSAEIG